MLFHCLYLLRNRWQQNHHAKLEISAINIKKTVNDAPATMTNSIAEGYSEKDTSLRHADPLAQYYLDWSHFSSTTGEDVDALLNSFWRKVFTPKNEESIQHSLTIMQLDSLVSTAELKVQYRRLAQIHHPDKGGDSDQFKKICQAFHQLKQYNLLSY